ncbi:MAG: molecular chaperone DnaJ [Myxococcota bacterium]|jgi:molecular chaperone DnaJ
MEAKRCYYEVLSVERDADGGTVKRAYRKMAMKFHPDRNPDDATAEDRFKEASEAYSVLSDADKRSTYDRFGHAGMSQQSMPQGGFEDIFSHFGDILGDIFGGGGGGGGRGRRQVRRGGDLRAELQISFEEAVDGTRRDVTFNRHDVCGTCEGDGAKPGTHPETCSSCTGSGRIARQQGFFMVQTTCPVCRGAGQIVKERCGGCEGDGVKQVQRTLSVKVPAGIDDGMRLRVAGEGETGGPDSIRGDLSITVRVEPHEVFQRDGSHLHLQQPISLSQATLGDDLEVRTLKGEEQVSIPPGTQSGTVIRLRNRGVTRLDGAGHGDLFVTLSIDVPDTLTAEQREAMEQLRNVGL